MESNKNALTIIRNLYPSMHKIEKKIAEFILEHPNDVVNMTVAKMAKELDIAQSSIIRFCKIIGFSGFSKLKLNLAQNVIKHENLIYKDIKLEDSINTIATKVFSSSIQTLKESLQFLDIKAIRASSRGYFRGEEDRILWYRNFFHTSSRCILSLDAYWHSGLCSC